MFGGHLPELIILFVLVLLFLGAVGLVWLFGYAFGRGVARGKRD